MGNSPFASFSVSLSNNIHSSTFSTNLETRPRQCWCTRHRQFGVPSPTCFQQQLDRTRTCPSSTSVRRNPYWRCPWFPVRRATTQSQHEFISLRTYCRNRLHQSWCFSEDSWTAEKQGIEGHWYLLNFFLIRSDILCRMFEVRLQKDDVSNSWSYSPSQQLSRSDT